VLEFSKWSQEVENSWLQFHFELGKRLQPGELDDSASANVMRMPSLHRMDRKLIQYNTILFY